MAKHDSPYPPPRLSGPTISRLALLAVDELSEVCRAGEEGPIEPTDTLKLAAGVLMLAGVCWPHQVRTLWQILRHEGDFGQASSRQSHRGTMLHGIRERATALSATATQDDRVD